MKMIAGCNSFATAKRARTSFSPSPTHLDVRLEALILRNDAVDSEATAFA